MYRRALSIALSAASFAAVLIAPTVAQAQAPPETAPVVKAGYGEADATWNVGAGAGQYTEKSPDQTNLLAGGDVDPHGHSTAQRDSYGVQARLSYRAIVVEDTEGDQVVFVKSDNYLAQDYLTRRVSQILAAEGSGVAYDEIFHMASHNHSSPYYQSPSWGVWLFQDVFDMRAFEYHARQMAAAILEAEESLVPARMGATTIEHNIFKGMIARRGLADDGTPIGYPNDFGDKGLPVIRFDSLEDPANPKPLATMINWGQHPEGLDDHDLITGDFIGPLERLVERATGAPLVFGQGDVGSAEAGPGRPELVPAGVPKKWSHVGHAQTERGAYFLARDVIKGWNEIGSGQPLVAYSSTFDVEAGNAFVPGPLSHPYPSASNCRTEPTAEGNPGTPLLNPTEPPFAEPPDCGRPMDADDRQQMAFEMMKEQGIPVPENYDAPAFTGVEENLRLKLQAFKMGEVLLASCACEAQVDLILNIESRADEAQGNIWDGFDWGKELGCTQASPGGAWTCRGLNGQENGLTIPDAAYQRMQAQVHNDAKGWDAPENAATANSEPADPSKIFGNFTKEELPADLGYKLPIGVGHAGDFNGYTVSYREYMSYDHYRKALTSYGPHTADYMATRLVKLAGELNGGPALPPEPHDAFGQADEARMVAASTAMGVVTSNAYDAWRAALPDDAGPPQAISQPKDIRRFDGTWYRWLGGSNAVDNPTVRVERLVDGKWETFADQSGEVQTMVNFPNGVNAMTDTYSGNQRWEWTANFEAFDSFPREIGSTPTGTYRFVVNGTSRQDGDDRAYKLTSKSFEVKPWDGIKVEDMQLGSDGSVSFTVPAYKYPETYRSPFRYIAKAMKNDEVGVPFCTTCSFRPWATSDSVSSATVTVVRRNGSTTQVAAQRGADGRWSAPTALRAGDRAFVASGGVVDGYGEINGAPSTTVQGTTRRASKLTLAVSGTGSRKTLSARLTGDEGEAIAGSAVEFFAGARRIGSATTSSSGTATLPVPAAYRGARTYGARFNGNAVYLPSSVVLR